jgi:hypothetical protein
MTKIEYAMSPFGSKALVNVSVWINDAKHTYPVVIDNHGDDEAKKAAARCELRKTLEEILEALGST